MNECECSNTVFNTFPLFQNTGCKFASEANKTNLDYMSFWTKAIQIIPRIHDCFLNVGLHVNTLLGLTQISR